LWRFSLQAFFVVVGNFLPPSTNGLLLTRNV